MYAIGWGFPTTWGRLVTAAYTWNSLRMIKLVRLRQGQLPAGSTASCNLASLPSEL